MTWKQIKRITPRNRNTIEAAIGVLLHAADWLQPRIEQGHHTNRDVVAWDDENGDAILVFQKGADCVAIPGIYAGEESAFRTYGGTWVILNDDHEIEARQ